LEKIGVSLKVNIGGQEKGRNKKTGIKKFTAILEGPIVLT